MAPSDVERQDELGRALAEAHFSRLYRDQVRAVLAYAVRRVDDPDDAADVVAETFLVAWRRLDDVPMGEAQRLWLYAVARRVIANVHRAERRRTRLGERLAESLRAGQAAQAEAGREAAELLRAMEGLSEEDRELLLLVSWEGLSPGQVAKVLGISSLAARSRLHRARRRLRALTDDRGAAEHRTTRLEEAG